MKHGTFYLLSKESNQKNDPYDLIKFVCKLVSTQWRYGKSILVTCENKNQAIKIDEALWMCDENSFLPHNLSGKNICNVPIVIYWSQCCYDNKPRDLLINLMKKNLNFFFNFNEIIDFVPITDTLKHWARIRYKSYRKTGFQLYTIDTSHIS